LKFWWRCRRVEVKSSLRVVGGREEGEGFRSNAFPDEMKCGVNRGGKHGRKGRAHTEDVRGSLRKGSDEGKEGEVVGVRRKSKASMSEGCGELRCWAASKPSLPLSFGRYKAIKEGEGVIILPGKPTRAR
jgi:hypothetical protein